MDFRPRDLQELAGTDPERLQWYRSKGWLPGPPLTFQQIWACDTAGRCRFDGQGADVLGLVFDALLHEGVPELCEAGPFWLTIDRGCVATRNGLPPAQRYAPPPYDPTGKTKGQPWPEMHHPRVYALHELWARMKEQVRLLYDCEV